MGNENNPCRKKNINQCFDVSQLNMIATLKQNYQHRHTTNFILQNLSFFERYHLVALILSTQQNFAYELDQYKYRINTQTKIYFFKLQKDNDKDCESAICLDFQKGEFYIGGFLNSLKSYKGLLIDKKGNLFDGYFKNNLPGGKGLWKSFYPKLSYSGQWYEGMRNGIGKQQFQDGTNYIGDFLWDKKCGKGILTFSDKKIFQGEFLQNSINGYGVLKTDNKQIKGLWKNGKFVQPDSPQLTKINQEMSNN